MTARDREQRVTEAFVVLSNALATGEDAVDLLATLTSVCAELLDVASAGLLLADATGVLHVLAASSENTRHLETFQLQRAEGPCLDCYASGSPVSVPDLEQETDRWPQFVAAATLAGIKSVHALPMHLQTRTLGALGLFGGTPGELGADDLRLGQAFADVASVALVQDKTAADQGAVNDQLQTALSSRVVVEQAKGVLAQLGELDMDESFAVLRQYSRDHNLRLSDCARGIVSRSLSATLVLDHARSRQSRPRR